MWLYVEAVSQVKCRAVYEQELQASVAETGTRQRHETLENLGMHSQGTEEAVQRVEVMEVRPGLKEN